MWQPFGKFCSLQAKVAPAIRPRSIPSGRLCGLSDSLAISPTVRVRFDRGAEKRPSSKRISSASAPRRRGAIVLALLPIFSAARWRARALGDRARPQGHRAAGVEADLGSLEAPRRGALDRVGEADSAQFPAPAC